MSYITGRQPPKTIFVRNMGQVHVGKGFKARFVPLKRMEVSKPVLNQLMGKETEVVQTPKSTPHGQSILEKAKSSASAVAKNAKEEAKQIMENARKEAEQMAVQSIGLPVEKKGLLSKKLSRAVAEGQGLYLPGQSKMAPSVGRRPATVHQIQQGVSGMGLYG